MRCLLIGLCLTACGGAPPTVGLPTVCAPPPRADPTPRIMGFCPSPPIRRLMRAQASRFVACFEAARQARPNLSGKVMLAWRIEPSGRVRSAGVRSRSIDDDCMLRCLLKVVESTEFPKGAGQCHVAYPLAFEGRD